MPPNWTTRGLTHPKTNEQWLEALSQPGEARDEALAALRGRLLKGLRAAMAGKGIDPAVLEDALQESLVKILASLETFQGKSRFETWAMTIAVRSVWTELRRRHWQHVSLESLVENQAPLRGETLKAEDDTGRGAEQSRLIARLHSAIETELTEKQRTALLAELAGMPQEEIARRMGSNRNALYKLVHDARKRLKKSLETTGLSLADVVSAFD